MKKTIISLATASLIASSAMAADKGIEFTTHGQAVLYYQTATDGASGSADLFHKDASTANVGVQLDITSDLGNGFAFGSQISYLGTDGLEKNLVSDTKQVSAFDDNKKIIENGGAGLDAANSTTNQLMLTKIYVAKKIANTTVKLGRQELPKALSPLAFSEGWNVFKNTFDAALVVNTDIPKTTLVAAYVGRSTGMDLSSVGNLSVSSSAGDLAVAKTAYMITAQNTALPMTTVTASYYALAGVDTVHSADAIWFDAKIADKSLPMGLKVGVQTGMIMPDKVADDTTAFGAKAGISPIKNVTVCGAFSFVNGNKDGKPQAAVKNTIEGAGNTPLYTQMIANKDAIALDNMTYKIKGSYSLNNYGTVTAQAAYTDAGSINLNGNGTDYTEFDLMYTTNVGGVDLLAAYVYQDWDTKNDKSEDIIRVVARYNF